MNETVIAFLKVSHNLVRTGMQLFLEVNPHLSVCF